MAAVPMPPKTGRTVSKDGHAHDTRRRVRLLRSAGEPGATGGPLVYRSPKAVAGDSMQSAT